MINVAFNLRIMNALCKNMLSEYNSQTQEWRLKQVRFNRSPKQAVKTKEIIITTDGDLFSSATKIIISCGPNGDIHVCDYCVKRLKGVFSTNTQTWRLGGKIDVRMCG